MHTSLFTDAHAVSSFFTTSYIPIQFHCILRELNASMIRFVAKQDYIFKGAF